MASMQIVANNSSASRVKVSKLGALLFLFALTMPFTRELKGINLVLFAVIFGIYGIFKKITNLIPKFLILFSGFSFLWAILSIGNLLPTAWTRMHEISAIPQQMLFAFALPTTFMVLRAYFSPRVVSDVFRRKLAIILILLWALSKIIGFIKNPANIDISYLIGIRQMGNNSALIIVAVSLYLSTLTSLVRRFPVILIFFVLSLLSIFSQNVVYALVFSAIWIFPKYSFKISGFFIGSSLLLYAIFIGDPRAVYFIDNNLTMRLILIGDAFSGFFQSFMLGVGFGTESITNNYWTNDVLSFTSEDQDGFINLAVHNSFATIAFRLGLIGFALFLIFLWRTVLIVKSGRSKQDVAFKSSMFVAFFVVAYQNPAMESYVYLYGACTYLAAAWSVGEGRC